MIVKLFMGKARGMALILIKKNVSILLNKRYYALWLRWAKGGIILPSGKKRIHWMFPRIGFVRMRTAPNAYPKLRHRY